MGGVETGAHALELIAAGASAVALGTVLFADPGAPARVREELAAEAAARGFEEPAAARGVAHGAVASAADAEPKGSGRVGLKL
jgi:dihydroorotate dehydrogenase (NAD+) catalytic subunit